MYNLEVRPGESVWLFQVLGREIERLESEYEELMSCPPFDDETEREVNAALMVLGGRIDDVKDMRRRVIGTASVNRFLKNV